MYERRAVKTRAMGRWLRPGAGVLLMWVGVESLAMSPATDAELAVLPTYCKDTQGFAGYGDSSSNTSPRAKTWVAMMGHTFWHLHHYCAGLVQRNRAMRAGVLPTERKAMLASAIGEYDYVLKNNRDPRLVLLPEIYTRVGEAQLLVANPGAADRAFARARAIKPDYWPAYSQWAEYLMQTGRQAEAKQLVKAGLQQAPYSKMLIEQYRLLGGKPSEIVPVVKKPLSEKAAAEQPATSDANSEIDGLPVESDSPDE